MIYGFTATRDLSGPWADKIVSVLSSLTDGDGFVTGAAIGGDRFIGEWLALNFPYKSHVVIVPTDHSRVSVWWEGLDNVSVYQMPEGTTYKDRNQEIVDRSNRVIGFPLYGEDDLASKRSGTWQTIRMAQRAEKLYRVVQLG